MNIIIDKPIITEKTLAKAATGWYTFAVDVDSRKEQIAKAINEAYKVDVVEVRTARMPGKARKTGRRQIKITKPDWKKAFIKLKAGQKIDVFESIMTQMQQQAK
jgi:large subunit ribosomal protein L23